MRIVHLLQVHRPPGLTYSELLLQVRVMVGCIGSSVHTTSSNSPQNEDLLPVPEGKRTWGYWNFIALYACPSQASTIVVKLILGRSWVADSFNINTCVQHILLMPSCQNSTRPHIDG